jgi:acetolactate synthase I/II/III large subunit
MSTAPRTGGDLVIETLTALGARTVFGVPGQHALGTFSALARSDLRYVGMRTELSAGFAADGYARAGERPGVLLTTTGPGSFVATCALM